MTSEIPAAPVEAQAEEQSPAEALNMLCHDIEFAIHILRAHIEAYDAILPPQLQRQFEQARMVLFVAQDELERIVLASTDGEMAEARVKNCGQAVQAVAAFLADELCTTTEHLLS